MLILLPPSEGKSEPARGKPLNLDVLSHPELTPVRRKIVDHVVELCASDPDRAAATLGLGPTQTDLVARNTRLYEAATARADHVYTGVLFEALGLDTLDGASKRRATRSVAVASAMFGLVRPGDRIPPYRLSGDVRLPGLGPVAGMWRGVLGPVLTEAVGRSMLLDLRSVMYVGLHKPAGALAGRTAIIRVLHEHRGQRKVVSHFNKATKGRIVRELLIAGAAPRNIGQLVDVLGHLGWVVEVDGNRLDVIVSEVPTS